MPHNFLLVHSPLVGPSTWINLARSLKAKMLSCTIPDLTESTLATDSYFSRQIRMVADCTPSSPVILVGHSGAGPLLAAASEVVPDLRGIIFVDAGLPHPGQSWIQTADTGLVEQLNQMSQGGWLPSWCEWWGPDAMAELLPEPQFRKKFCDECPRLPFAMFNEVHPLVLGGLHVPAAYLRLSEGYEDAALRAEQLGCP